MTCLNNFFLVIEIKVNDHWIVVL